MVGCAAKLLCQRAAVQWNFMDCEFRNFQLQFYSNRFIRMAKPFVSFVLFHFSCELCLNFGRCYLSLHQHCEYASCTSIASGRLLLLFFGVKGILVPAPQRYFSMRSSCLTIWIFFHSQLGADNVFHLHYFRLLLHLLHHLHLLPYQRIRIYVSILCPVCMGIYFRSICLHNGGFYFCSRCALSSFSPTPTTEIEEMFDGSWEGESSGRLYFVRSFAQNQRSDKSMAISMIFYRFTQSFSSW